MKTIHSKHRKQKPSSAGPSAPGSSPDAHSKSTKKQARPKPEPQRAGLSSKWVRNREDHLELGSWSYFSSFHPLLAAMLFLFSFAGARAADAGGGGGDRVVQARDPGQ